MTPTNPLQLRHGQRPRRAVATIVAFVSLAVASSTTFAAPAESNATTTPTTTTTTAPPTTTPTTTTTSPAGTTTTTTVPAVTTTTVTKTTTKTTTNDTVTPASTAPTTAPTAAPVTVKVDAAPAPKNIRVYPKEVGNILATIRYMESRGQYFLPPNKGNASGAYQFIGSTWQNYGGFAHAYLAPPEVQDERAAKDVNLFLSQWNNDVSMIPVLWYYPRAAKDPALMDVVPVPSAGNTLTIREYQQRWLATFSTISGQPVPPSGQSFLGSILALGLAPAPPERDDNLPSLEFPVLGPSQIAAPDCEATESTDLEAAGLCTEMAPSIVFGVKLQPIRSVIDGIVTAVDDEPASGRPISVTLTDVNGRSYVYDGFNDDNPGTSDGNAPAHLRLTALAEVGTTVWAGQIIGFMGDTDPIPLGVRGEVATDASVHLHPDAIAPHIRLSIHEVDGTPVDAFGPVLDALFRTGCTNGIGRWSVPARSSTTAAVTVETTDNNTDIDSEWIITSTGQVQASGWAALISPGEPCKWTPTGHYGPGAAGANDVPAHWAAGLDLSTDVWLQIAFAGDNGTDAVNSPFFRF